MNACEGCAANVGLLYHSAHGDASVWRLVNQMNKTMTLGVLASLTVLVAISTPATAIIGGAYAVPPTTTLAFVVPGTFSHLVPITGFDVSATASVLPGGANLVMVQCNEPLITCTGTIIIT